MTLPEHLIAAAARELAGRLLPPAPAARPRVAEAVMEEPGGEEAGPRLKALEELARQVVETVLALSGRGLTEAELGQALRRAAEAHLDRLGAAAGGVRARLVASLPGLVNLPELMRLAAGGLRISPLQAAREPEPEPVGGLSPEFAKVLGQLEQVAQTDLPVLLLGETGTGKEVLARRLHRLSPRRQGPFVAVNCAALAKSLMESELFGHVKGAFTGADGPGAGYLRAAQGGTLFLDELGEASPELQVRLLRVLEDQVVVPVGAATGQRVDFRLVAASSRDLAGLVEAGGFNQALFYRVQVVPIHLPPLRRRREDLPELIDHFLTKACQQARRTRRLSPELRRRLMEHAWPGNLRELMHLIQRLVALAPDYEIGPAALPPEFGRADGPGEALRRRLEAMDGPAGRHAGALAGLLAERRGRELANRDVRDLVGCSDSTAKNLLRTLVEAGLVAVVGDRGGRRYRVRDLEEEL
ncbi:MAG: sigma 54-interacting transcriptional regulator [Thermodesulfobacteriota bacterium]